MTRYKIMIITVVALLALIITACGTQTSPADTIASNPTTETKSSLPTAVPTKPVQAIEPSSPPETSAKLADGLVWVANGMEDSLSAYSGENDHVFRGMAITQTGAKRSVTG